MYDIDDMITAYIEADEQDLKHRGSGLISSPDVLRLDARLAGY